MRLILASASPRRRQLLEMLGLRTLTVRPARGAEAPHPELGPAELVLALSRAKAEEAARESQAGDAVLGADTVVYAQGRVLGKPRDAADAADMLRLLSGREHEVYTGMTLLTGAGRFAAAERTAVRFRPLTPAEIDAYVATGEPFDKAGAYGIQGRASLFVQGIEGDYFNVMGLPLCALGQLCRQAGLELLEF